MNGGAARWLAAAVVLAAGGGLAVFNALRIANSSDGISALLGNGPGVAERLFDGPGGLSVRIDAAQRAALGALVKANPLNGTAVALLALDRQAQGDAAGATALGDQALKIEPRTRLARLARLDRQTRAGDPVAAATSTIRLLMIDSGRKAVYLPILVSLARDARTVPVISQALVGDQEWGPSFVAMLIDGKVDPAIRYALMNPTKKASTSAEADRDFFVRNLAGTGDVERAYLAWLAFLPDSALSKVGAPYDAHFEGLPGATPFNWKLTSTDGDRASIENGALNVSYSGRAPVTLAKQIILPKPGSYRLRSVLASVENVGQNSATTFTWNAYCLPSGKVVASLAIDLKAVGRAQQSPPFDVPAADCSSVALQLDGSTSEFPIRLAVSLSSVELIPSASALSSVSVASGPTSPASPKAQQ